VQEVQPSVALMGSSGGLLPTAPPAHVGAALPKEAGQPRREADAGLAAMSESKTKYTIPWRPSGQR
jgi:hypothetical protein